MFTPNYYQCVHVPLSTGTDYYFGSFVVTTIINFNNFIRACNIKSETLKGMDYLRDSG